MLDGILFAKFPLAVMGHGDLTLAAKVVFAAIVNRIGDNGECWAGQRRFAEDVKVDLSTINRAMGELVAAGLINIQVGSMSGPRENRRSRISLNVRNLQTLDESQRSEKANVGRTQKANVNVRNLRTELDPLSRPIETRPILPPAEPAKKKPVKPKAPRPPRERDPIWDVVQELWHPDGVPTGQQSAVGAIVRDLKELGATVELVRAARDAYRREWPEMTCTPRAVVKFWSKFNGHQAATDNAAFAARMEKAGKNDKWGILE
jgi:DNA-binding transcriptional regulator YhcF (GntR family)